MTEVRWVARLDASRKDTDFNDLLKIVASYYELYEKAARFVSPWIARQIGSTMPFMAPEKDQLKRAIGGHRSVIHSRAYSAFIESLHNFIHASKGKRTLISPNHTTHHSAQFPMGTFSINRVGDRDSKKYQIELFGAERPIFVEGLTFPPESISFIIVRPKLGKLGTASAIRWEVLFYKQNLGYLIDHVDSNLNPRYAGIL